VSTAARGDNFNFKPMPQKLPNYIRAARREAGLSQAEVAFLLGCRSGTKVSRYERFARHPNVATMFACAVIFQIPVERLFAGAYQRAIGEVAKRVQALVDSLAASRDNPASQRKLAALSAIAGTSRGRQPDDTASV
jgi:transcriptional regulator with XRE-family HTH domain